MNREDSLFAFYLGTKEDAKGLYKNCINFGKYCLSYSMKTIVNKVNGKESELIILGDAIDLQTGDASNLASMLLLQVQDIQSLIEREYYIGGKYVIFYHYNDKYYIFGDATCSIPVYYINSMDHGFVFASNLWDIISRHHFEKDKYLLRIRDGGDISQAMPYDYTVYKEVRQLLPNHYLEVTSEKIAVCRFVNQPEPELSLLPEEAAKTTLPWIENLTKYYMSKYDVCCPITSGRDSRVVLAFLRTQNNRVPCYTIKHENFSGREQDLTVPVELCKKAGLPYNQIQDINLSSERIKEADAILGFDMYAQQTLKIADTVKAFCQGRAIINGDIIGQVGKCSLHRDIPERLATPSYFLCKLHNFSREAKAALREWMDEIKKSNESVSIFDLFSVENRMGRWAAQENLIFNTIGQYYFNIFNSRCVIYTWTRVLREIRKTSALHIELIKLLDINLLDIPFGSESLALRIAKSTGLTYYCASFLKHGVECYRFKKNKGYKCR